ncbi:MAG TPA: 50S ribosomal protein L11 methyltransferase [Chthoniobacterales bacterium]|nr:50S ribosomal protein L11 methyltransferase [Chthoniobacterales bacterium]
MYLWRRRAGRKWLNENEEELRAIAGNALAVIEQPNREPLHLEFASNQRVQLENVAKEFGGRIEQLPRDWLKRALSRKTKGVKVGTRQLRIPAGAAFGTGEHATTAMLLRLLEKLTRDWDQGWSILDLGTGSGILTLAAKILGAGRAIGIDNDPLAVSTAKQNARLNKIRDVSFRAQDIRNWKFPRSSRLRSQPDWHLGSGAQVDIVIANLYSELLIEILPKIRAAHWLVLSGILRTQENAVKRALRRNRIDIIELRRRGKWVAILAASS